MRSKPILGALGIACALVIGIDYVTFAATGQGVVLGKVNQADKVTTFERTTNGPAASFVTKPGKQPFTVKRQAKVVNLNADKLDGRDSTSFATRTPTKIYTFTAPSPATTHTFDLGALTPGRYLVSYDAGLADSAATAATPQVWGQCYLRQDSSFITTSLKESATSVWNPTIQQAVDIALSGSGLVDTAQGAFPDLVCAASKAWRTSPASFPLAAGTIRVTVTRIESSTMTTGVG